jgi:ubiquinone/menaquinone biosynthesis C-methylase UbiE
MAEASDLNRTAYDRWSVAYDQYPNSTVAMDEMHFPGVWRHLSGKRVLEIGCGTGRHTLKLARRGNEVVGIDLSPGMLAVARRTLHGHPVKLIHADFMAYDGFADRDFDAVVASLVLEHIEDTAGFCRRVARVLRRLAAFTSRRSIPYARPQGRRLASWIRRPGMSCGR